MQDERAQPMLGNVVEPDDDDSVAHDDGSIINIQDNLPVENQQNVIEIKDVDGNKEEEASLQDQGAASDEEDENDKESAPEEPRVRTRSGRQPKEQDFYGEKVNTIVEEGDPEEKVDEYMHSMLDEDQANTVDL
jgi:hypothetical protein